MLTTQILSRSNRSLEGTAKKPKCSLLKFYPDQIILALEEKVVQQLSENGKVNVVIVKQEDNFCN